MSDSETSNFTSNINNYWNEHKVSDYLNEHNASNEDLAENRATMSSLYGENQKIFGPYDEGLAAKTYSGTYVGKKDANGIISWKGVPFAKQPVGNLRWRAPESPEKDNAVYQAYYFGSSSLQVESKDETSSSYPQGEDCLNLNVWSNSNNPSDNKPIMVWIHGGAYIQGGSSEPQYEGTDFVKNNPDVIFVSFDYRTDILGFINLSEVEGGEKYKDTANLGLLDEVAALKWIKENARAFGGDPDRITIFGESAGGGSVSALTIAPQAKGLFKRAIMQSGSTTNLLRTEEKSISRTQKIMDITGAKSVDDLLTLTEKDIQKLEAILIADDPVGYTFPQLDGVVLPYDLKGAVDSSRRDGIDIMLGTTKDEYNYWTKILGRELNYISMKKALDNLATKLTDDQKARLQEFQLLQPGDEYNKLLQTVSFTSFHSPARYEARTHSDRGQNVYLYYFTEESTDQDLLSHHGFELGFLFGNLDTAHIKDLEKAKKLSKTMQKMWVNFAIKGDPSITSDETDGIQAVNWEKYTSKDQNLLVINSEDIKMATDPLARDNALIEDIFWAKLNKQISSLLPLNTAQRLLK